MLKKTVTFNDFNGKEHKQDLYFHVSKTAVLTASDEVYNEIVDIGKQLQQRGEMLEASGIEVEVKADDPFDADNQLLAGSIRMVARLLDRLVDLSYGKRSEDGLRFSKNPVVLAEFKESAVYDAFVEQMLANQDEMIDFINQLLNAN